MTLFPMHQAGLDIKDLCDSCQELFLYDDLTWIVTYRQTFIDPEEGVMVCDECIGETDE